MLSLTSTDAKVRIHRQGGLRTQKDRLPRIKVEFDVIWLLAPAFSRNVWNLQQDGRDTSPSAVAVRQTLTTQEVGGRADDLFGWLSYFYEFLLGWTGKNSIEAVVASQRIGGCLLRKMHHIVTSLVVRFH